MSNCLSMDTACGCRKNLSVRQFVLKCIRPCTSGQCWNWPKRTGGSAVEMFEILHRDWNLKPIFTRKWVSVDMIMIELGVEPPTPRQFQPWIEASQRTTNKKWHMAIEWSRDRWRHVTLKGKTRYPIRLERNILKTTGFRDSVPKDHNRK